MEAAATMVPLKMLFVPKVAELPTAQNTSQAELPFTNATTDEVAVVRVDAI